nr:protein spaetzle 3 isoform X2 [Nomia melanderi]
MSLVNFTLPYQSATPTPFFYGGQTGGHSSVNNLRLNAVLPPAPAPNFNDREPFQNEPYIPPAGYQQQKQHQTAFNRQTTSNSYIEHSSFSSTQDTRYDNYNQDFRRTQPRQQQQRPAPPISQQQRSQVDRDQSNHRTSRMPEDDSYPERPNGYTRVSGEGGPGTKTSVHAVLDYDDDFEDYYDDDDQDIPKDAHVTPIQGPIFLKNGSVPVVPLYSYPQLNNGTFVQIPILWTALSVALGVELRGDLIRGVPCIKKFHQLFCPTAGNAYPIERIERFIDENKALMRRMYGDFEMSSGYGAATKEPGHRTRRRRKSREARKHDLPDGGPSFRDSLDPDIETNGGDSFFAHIRKTRNPRQSPGKNQNNESGRVDACESKVEIVTPYWASNSAGKIRAIVNTQHFEQAIHQEVCS